MAGVEGRLQSKIAEWARSQGAIVLVTRVLPGVPVGFPDIVILYRDRHSEIEVKKSATAPFRPGQGAMLERLRKGNLFVYVAHPDNWLLIKADLAERFFV